MMGKIEAVIFDLDGVIVSTDELHFRAWKELAEAEGIPFTREDNERLRGVSRMESLDILLEKACRTYSESEKIAMATCKNTIYRESLSALSAADILPGATVLLRELRERGVKLAIGSSSKNAGPILEAIGLDKAFDAVVDGTHLLRSKPDPEVFRLAAERLGVAPDRCLVVEDADAGVVAGVAAGMAVLAVGTAAGHALANINSKDLSKLTVDAMLGVRRSL